MLRKSLIAIAALVALVIAAALVAPYFIGGRAEMTFRANIAAFDARHTGLKLTIVGYRRGFYRSEATLAASTTGYGGAARARLLRLFLGSGGNPKLHVEINHGPIAIGAFTTHFSLTPVLYTADFRAANLPALSVLGAFKPEFYDVAWLTGGDRLTVDVPPGRSGFGVFGAQWRGGHMVINTNTARDRMRSSGHMEAITFEGMDPQRGTTVHGRLEPASWSARSRRSPYGYWTGSGSGQAQGLTISSGGMRLATIGPVSVHAESGITYDGKQLYWRLDVKQRGGVLRGWHWHALDSLVAVHGLDAAGLGHALRQLRGMQASGPSRARGEMLQILGESVTAQTRGLLRVSLDAPAGTAGAGAGVYFAAAPAPGSAVGPLARAHGLLRVSFPRGLVLDFAGKVFGPEAQEHIRNELATLLQIGYLQTGADGRYFAAIAWGPQGATVNGLPVGRAPAAATGAGL